MELQIKNASGAAAGQPRSPMDLCFGHSTRRWCIRWWWPIWPAPAGTARRKIVPRSVAAAPSRFRQKGNRSRPRWYHPRSVVAGWRRDLRGQAAGSLAESQPENVPRRHARHFPSCCARIGCWWWMRWMSGNQDQAHTRTDADAGFGRSRPRADGDRKRRSQSVFVGAQPARCGGERCGWPGPGQLGGFREGIDDGGRVAARRGVVGMNQERLLKILLAPHVSEKQPGRRALQPGGIQR